MQYKCFFAQIRTRSATSRASICHQRKQIEFTQNRLLTTENRRQKNSQNNRLEETFEHFEHSSC